MIETSELEEVKADIRATKADIVEAKKVRDKSESEGNFARRDRHEETILKLMDYLIKLTDYLIKLQDKKNILLTQRQALGEIPHNSTTN